MIRPRSILPLLAATLLLGISVTGCSKAGGDKPTPKSDSKSDGKGDSKKQGGSEASDTKGKSSAQSDTVTLTAEQQQRAGIRIAQVQSQEVARSLQVSGQVGMDEQHTAHIGALADGRITSAPVLPGADVRRGQTLAELHSHTIHETVGALAQAFAAVDRQRAAVTFAKEARDRYQHLYSIQAASLEETQRADQQLVQANTELASAEASVRMEREHLSELLQVCARIAHPRQPLQPRARSHPLRHQRHRHLPRGYSRNGRSDRHGDLRRLRPQHRLGHSFAQ